MPGHGDIAWFAGLFEGEGCFELRRQASRPDAARSVRLTIGMSDLDVLRKVNLIFPGTITEKRWSGKKDTHKPMWQWRVSNADDCKLIIDAIWPWLGHRRQRRAQELLNAIDARPEPGSTRSTHCANGHELTDENLLPRYGTKYRRCRTCARANWARSNANRKVTPSHPGRPGSPVAPTLVGHPISNIELIGGLYDARPHPGRGACQA